MDHYWQIGGVCQAAVDLVHLAFKPTLMVRTSFAPASLFHPFYRMSHFQTWFTDGQQPKTGLSENILQRTSFCCISLLQIDLGKMWVAERGLCPNQLNQFGNGNLGKIRGDVTDHAEKTLEILRNLLNLGRPLKTLHFGKVIKKTFEGVDQIM